MLSPSKWNSIWQNLTSPRPADPSYCWGMIANGRFTSPGRGRARPKYRGLKSGKSPPPSRGTMKSLQYRRLSTPSAEDHSLGVIFFGGRTAFHFGMKWRDLFTGHKCPARMWAVWICC